MRSHRVIVASVGFVAFFRTCDISLAFESGARERKGAQNAAVLAYRSDGLLPKAAEEVLEAEFTAFSRKFFLRLHPSTVVDPEFTESYVTDDSGTRRVPTVNHSFVGRVVGEPDSDVRLTLVRQALKGVIQSQGETYFIEPRAGLDKRAKAGEILVYRASENPPLKLPDDDVVRSEADAVETDGSVDSMIPPEMRSAPGFALPRLVYDNDNVPPADTFMRRIDLGVLSDSRFYLVNHGGSSAQTAEQIAAAENETFADMEATINSVDGMYRKTVPVSLRIVQRDILKTSSAENAAGIPQCPTICMSAPPPAVQVANPGTRCLTNAECTISGTTCRQIPFENWRCTGGTLHGRACFSNLDCPGGTCRVCIGGPNSGQPCSSSSNCPQGSCPGPNKRSELCYRGTSPGRLCQSDSCTSAGNCCTGSGSRCMTPFQGPSWAAAKYRNSGTGIFNKTNTASLHLFSGCSLWGASSTARICNPDNTQESGSVTGYYQDIGGTANPASDDVFTAAHEIGHSIMGGGSPHDNEELCQAVNLPGDIFSTNLRILGFRCTNGTYEMCVDSTSCGGGSCSMPNQRACGLPPPYGSQTCARSSDCSPGSSCLTDVSDRTCVGGTNAGKKCREFAVPSACPGGTCTGAPLSYEIYYMSGGTLGGFSPCSKAYITNYLAEFPKPSPYDPNAACPPAFLTCHDVNRSGTISASDAQRILAISVGTHPYDDLADLGGVLPPGSPQPPDGAIVADEANYTLMVSVGTKPAAPSCGIVEPAWIP